jgi:hypothetical protein
MTAEIIPIRFVSSGVFCKSDDVCSCVTHPRPTTCAVFSISRPTALRSPGPERGLLQAKVSGCFPSVKPSGVQSTVVVTVWGDVLHCLILSV